MSTDPTARPRRPLGLTRANLRDRVTDTNDGIVSIAGIVEGLVTAGATGTTVAVAAVAALVAGSIAVGGTAFTESSDERDLERALMEEERRQLAQSPQEELDELTRHYEIRGLRPDLARQVAQALTERDALAAHVEAEHGITPDDRGARPTTLAVLACAAFVIGGLVPLIAITVAPDALRVPVTFLATVASLAATSVVVARTSHTSVPRTVVRSVAIGVLAMLLGLAVGFTFHDEVAEDLATAALLGLG